MTAHRMPVQVYLDDDFDVHFEDGDRRRLAEHAWLCEVEVAVGLILTDRQAPNLGRLMRTICHDEVFGCWEWPYAAADGS